MKTQPHGIISHSLITAFWILATAVTLLIGSSSGSLAEIPRLSATEPEALNQHIGDEVVVQEEVPQIGRTPDGHITFLNFGPRNSGFFVGLIFASACPEFPDGLDHFQEASGDSGPREE
jgi:hypothetical protein